jgi:DNA-binding transcriptional regulator YhcF (GntR family)
VVTSDPWQIRIDTGSPDPPYHQIRLQVARLIDAGKVGPGAQLPTVRQLALRLGVATNTVARAYRELEHRGLVVTRGRLGTVVSGDGITRASKEAAADFVARLTAMGLDREQILELVHDHLEPPKSS